MCVAALLAPSAFTAAYFFLGKSRQNRLLLHPALRCATGPLATAPSGPARPTTCCASLHLAPSANAEGCCAPGPTDAYARPPDVAKLAAAPPLALSSKDRPHYPQQHKTIGKGKSESAAIRLPLPWRLILLLILLLLLLLIYPRPQEAEWRWLEGQVRSTLRRSRRREM